MPALRVLGVDPGTAVVGFGVVDAVPGRPGRLIECGVIRTGAQALMADRLQIIYEGVRELMERHQPAVLAVEGIFFGKNARSTALLGHARGVILLAGAERGATIAEYPPAVVKKTIVNRGAATKAQVGYMVAKLLGLKSAPTPADAADGVAIALTHLLRRPHAARRAVS